MTFRPQAWFDIRVTVHIRTLSTYEFVRATPDLVDIYITAMGYSPAIFDARVQAWKQHTQTPGFKSVVAIDESKVVGLAYGHSGSPMSWWHSQIQRELHKAGKYGADERRLLANYFELSEIHVLPYSQGLGVGKQLLLALTEGVRHPEVLLSTPEVADESNGAFRLYRRFGFEDLLRNCTFSGDHRPFAILHAALPLSDQNPH